VVESSFNFIEKVFRSRELIPLYNYFELSIAKNSVDKAKISIFLALEISYKKFVSKISSSLKDLISIILRAVKSLKVLEWLN